MHQAHFIVVPKSQSLDQNFQFVYLDQKPFPIWLWPLIRGMDGADGREGEKGEKGCPGIVGDRGSDGPPGTEKGRKGERGSHGTQGPRVSYLN